MKYSVYRGKFKCQECKEESESCRFYYKSFDLTWMCPQKHLSTVSLDARGY